MAETQEFYFGLLDFHYSIHTELENLTDEEMLLWREEQSRIAQVQAGSIDLLLERYAQTGSKLYIESAQSLRKTAAVHNAMARLPNPYKTVRDIPIHPFYRIVFWDQ